MSSVDVLQLCPNDRPPFGEVCSVHARALALCGARVRTVFLDDGRSSDADGLHLGSGSSSRRAESALASRGLLSSCDWIVAHRYRGYRVAARIRRGLGHVRVLAMAHELGFFGRRRRRWRHAWGNSEIRLAGVSPVVVDDLLASLPSLDTPILMPNAIDVAAADQARLGRDRARSHLRLPLDELVVGVVGRLHEKKRPVEALRTFAASELGEGVHLAYLGDGPLRGAVEQAGREHGLGARLHVLGDVPGAARYFGGLDVLLHVADAREAFGMVLIEAMAAGTPIVAADAPGPQSVVGPAAFWFDHVSFAGAGDSLRAALGGTDRVQQHARANRARVIEQFSVQALARRYAELFESSGTLNTVGVGPRDAS